MSPLFQEMSWPVSTRAANETAARAAAWRQALWWIAFYSARLRPGR